MFDALSTIGYWLLMLTGVGVGVGLVVGTLGITLLYVMDRAFTTYFNRRY